MHYLYCFFIEENLYITKKNKLFFIAEKMKP